MSLHSASRPRTGHSHRASFSLALALAMAVVVGACQPVERIPEPVAETEEDGAPELRVEEGEASEEDEGRAEDEDASEAAVEDEEPGEDDGEGAGDGDAEEGALEGVPAGGLPDLAPPPDSGVVMLQEPTLRGLAVFMTDAVRPDAALITQSARLRDELEEDPSRIEDPTWLAGAVPVAEAVKKVGQIIDTGLTGGAWPEEMEEMVESGVRARVVVPMVSSSTAFLAASKSEDAERSLEALDGMARGVDALGQTLLELTELMLAEEEAAGSATE